MDPPSSPPAPPSFIADSTSMAEDITQYQPNRIPSKGTENDYQVIQAQAQTFVHVVPEAYLVDHESSLRSHNVPPAMTIDSADATVAVDEALIRGDLLSTWPRGLQSLFLTTIAKCPIRYMICDDSGSMNTNDGHRLLGTGASTKLVECSRWTELADSLRFHARVSHIAHARTEFRLLNGYNPILLGAGAGVTSQATEDFATFLNLLDNSPEGGTPLCAHVNAVVAAIQPIAAQLRSAGQRAVVVIFTDGESTDGNIASAMMPLAHLPVLVVVRLCTDDSRIVDYWNGIDAQLELSIDVLDDLVGEALEVGADCD